MIGVEADGIDRLAQLVIETDDALTDEPLQEQRDPLPGFQKGLLPHNPGGIALRQSTWLLILDKPRSAWTAGNCFAAPRMAH
jgi:hypothetical protein